MLAVGEAEDVGWTLRDQQPERTVQHSEAEYRINNR